MVVDAVESVAGHQPEELLLGEAELEVWVDGGSRVVGLDEAPLDKVSLTASPLSVKFHWMTKESLAARGPSMRIARVSNS